jgi:3'(2'), 5'-bisphosphate nucleotidase
VAELPRGAPDDPATERGGASDAVPEKVLGVQLSFEADPGLARLLAIHAGVILVRLRGAMRGAHAEQLRAEGEQRVHDFLSAALRRLRPADAVLCKGGTDDLRRLNTPRVWILDPLDGSREYAESGRRDWAVHVALWERGELVAGAVALPGLGPTLSTEHPPQQHVRHRGPLRMLVSRSDPPQYAAAAAERLRAELVPMGSAGAKAMAIVRGEADLYLHDGGQYEWDSAAPVAVVRAAGLHASRADGSPLQYNNPDPYLPDLLICRQDLRDRALAVLAETR